MLPQINWHVIVPTILAWMHSIAQGTDTNIFWSNQAWLACSE
jgi:hypothetical protein